MTSLYYLLYCVLLWLKWNKPSIANSSNQVIRSTVSKQVVTYHVFFCPPEPEISPFLTDPLCMFMGYFILKCIKRPHFDVSKSNNTFYMKTLHQNIQCGTSKIIFTVFILFMLINHLHIHDGVHMKCFNNVSLWYRYVQSHTLTSILFSVAVPGFEVLKGGRTFFRIPHCTPPPTLERFSWSHYTSLYLDYI